jgi:hypothetical protein
MADGQQPGQCSHEELQKQLEETQRHEEERQRFVRRIEKQQEEDDGRSQGYVPISKIFVDPDHGPTTQASVNYSSSIPPGTIGVMIELTANAEMDQTYNVMFGSVASVLPMGVTMTVLQGSRYSNFFTFPGPLYARPTSLTITARWVQNFAMSGQLSVWLKA